MKKDNSKYVVQIINDTTIEVAWQSEPTTFRQAETIERGANINLDHENFYTDIVRESDAKGEPTP